MNSPPGFRGVFRDDDEARAVYSEAAGIGQIIPAAVAVPADADDVATLVRWAFDNRLALTPRGSGSSMASGAIGRGVIVDLSQLNGIGEVDRKRASILVGPGAICGEVNAVAENHGLRFPVEPSSTRFCTVGGMASTNAAGARSLRYGAMRNWVTALDCIFSDGTRGTVRRDGDLPENVPAIGRFLHELRPMLPGPSDAAHADHAGVEKDSSGYGLGSFARTGDLIDILLGSEGTLAIFVGVELALQPVPPARTGVMAAFPDMESAMLAAIAARAAGATACELLEKTFLDILDAERPADGVDESRWHRGTSAVLLGEVEGATPERVAEGAHRLGEAFRNAGATSVDVALSDADQAEMWDLRHGASQALARLSADLRSLQVIEDGAVPLPRLAEYVRGVRAALDRAGMRGVVFGHAGDGHVHVNPLLDLRRDDWRRALDDLLGEVTDLVAKLGGTLAGEHGDGRLRTPLLGRVWSAATLDIFSAIKNAFDPRAILNPGVKVAEAGQRPIEAVKYDPKLAPLPPAARRALDLVAAEKGYGKFRLSLLEGSE